MLKIAICDDEPYVCSDIENMLLKYEKDKMCQMKMEFFFSGESLYKYLNDNEVDLIFLDIVLVEMNGVEVGERIREHLCNDTIQIVYISAKESYAMSLFESRPLDFLVKPITYDEVAHVMDKAVRIIDKNELLFTYKKGHSYEKIQFKNILYMVSENKQIHIVTTKDVQTFYGKLDLLGLPEDVFWRVHKSYLVNIHQIKRYYYEKIIMDNKDVIPISQSYRSVIREKIIKSWEKIDE